MSNRRDGLPPAVWTLSIGIDVTIGSITWRGNEGFFERIQTRGSDAYAAAWRKKGCYR